MTTLTLNLNPIIKLTDEQFFQLCQENENIRLERTAKGELIIMSPAGGASLPPGMLAFKGDKALANYLVSKSIRYIAYSSWSLNHPADVDTSGPGLSSWFRLQSQLSHDFRDNVQQLAKTRKKLYQDGENFVLDLEIQRK